MMGFNMDYINIDMPKKGNLNGAYLEVDGVLGYVGNLVLAQKYYDRRKYTDKKVALVCNGILYYSNHKSERFNE